MRFKTSSASLALWLVGLCLLPASMTLAAPAGESKYEAILVWATNADKSPDPSHKPVDAGVLKKLKGLPLKWKNYFEVSRADLVVPRNGVKEVTLSDQCRIGVKDIDG